MERGATASCIFKFPTEVIFENIEAMRLYINSTRSTAQIVKELGQADVILMPENKIRVDLSQEDTLQFVDNEDLRLQWHWRNKDGTAKTSRIIETNIYEFLGREPV